MWPFDRRSFFGTFSAACGFGARREDNAAIVCEPRRSLETIGPFRAWDIFCGKEATRGTACPSRPSVKLGKLHIPNLGIPDADTPGALDENNAVALHELKSRTQVHAASAAGFLAIRIKKR